MAPGRAAKGDYELKSYQTYKKNEAAMKLNREIQSIVNRAMEGHAPSKSDCQTMLSCDPLSGEATLIRGVADTVTSAPSPRCFTAPKDRHKNKTCKKRCLRRQGEPP
ncbi:hypothetical protein DSLASN_21850 [Desulfoluna limicola]|uniref:Uncharacterized protein n=1 Tax=Desulfoluna limicola TaxID=2810562 RepID=A0ABN6F461_9BACT|nr:hypothetical protein DSLASN_21850 [Desulfoluna limicola]